MAIVDRPRVKALTYARLACNAQTAKLSSSIIHLSDHSSTTDDPIWPGAGEDWHSAGRSGLAPAVEVDPASIVGAQVLAPGLDQQIPLLLDDINQGLAMGQMPANRIEFVPGVRRVDRQREIAAALAGAEVAQALTALELGTARLLARGSRPGLHESSFGRIGCH